MARRVIECIGCSQMSGMFWIRNFLLLLGSMVRLMGNYYHLDIMFYNSEIPLCGSFMFTPNAIFSGKRIRSQRHATDRLAHGLS